MRSLIDAALEAQAQRVIDAHPRELREARYSGSLHSGSCLLCGRRLGTKNGSGRQNVSGYCSHTNEVQDGGRAGQAAAGAEGKMRSLVDAALEDQTRRVLEAQPRDLPRCGASEPGGQHDRSWIRLVSEAEKLALEKRKRRMVAAVRLDPCLDREVLSERFGFSEDMVYRLLAEAGLHVGQPWWWGMRHANAAGPQHDPYRGTNTHRRAAKVGPSARGGNPP